MDKNDIYSKLWEKNKYNSQILCKKIIKTEKDGGTSDNARNKIKYFRRFMKLFIYIKC